MPSSLTTATCKRRVACQTIVLEELAEQYTVAEAAIEAPGHYRPIYEMFNKHLYVTLVNASKNRIIADVAVKTDPGNAKRLAHILRVSMLAESYVPPDEIPQNADLVRTRRSLAKPGQLKKPC